MAAVLTGGRVLSIGLSANEGGVCVTQGGIPFVVLNAGYLGSLLFGALFLLLGTPPAQRGARARRDRRLHGRRRADLRAHVVRLRLHPDGGLRLLLVAVRLRPEVSEWLLAAIGSMSMLYAVADMASDVILRHSGASDAAALARLTHVPALAWGLVWIAVSLAVLVCGGAQARLTRGRAAPPLAQAMTPAARRIETDHGLPICASMAVQSSVGSQRHGPLGGPRE